MIEREFSVGDRPELEVEIQSGRVEIKEGAPGRVRVSVETSDPGFVVEQRGDLVMVSSDRDKSWLARRSALVVVEAPPGVDCDITTASARVDCEVPVGRISVRTASGDIDIARADTATIKTASGDTAIGSVTRAVRFASASGRIHIIEDCAGTGVFSTASGDVRIGNASATIEANTASGDIEIASCTGRGATFKSMSGQVTVGVPGGTSLDLDASLLSGRLRVPEPQDRSGPADRQMAIKAKLVSGDLVINRV